MDKIICIGKNYHEHIKELAHLSPSSESLNSDFSTNQDKNIVKPVIFIKPPSVLQTIKNKQTGKLKYPQDSGSLHFETEIVLRVHKECFKASPENGHKYFDAVSIGLDMTLRDLQTIQKQEGSPWTTSKVFPDSAVCGEWIEIEKIPDFDNTLFSFTLNGVQRQVGKASDMILSCGQCISFISQFFRLFPGDMVYTGTPAGVGPVQIGDVANIHFHNINYSVEWVR